MKPKTVLKYRRKAGKDHHFKDHFQFRQEHNLNRDSEIAFNLSYIYTAHGIKGKKSSLSKKLTFNCNRLKLIFTHYKQKLFIYYLLKTTQLNPVVFEIIGTHNQNTERKKRSTAKKNNLPRLQRLKTAVCKYSGEEIIPLKCVQSSEVIQQGKGVIGKKCLKVLTGI